MRLNKFIATHYGVSRRAADAAIAAGHIKVNKQPAEPGMQIHEVDQVYWAGKKQIESKPVTLLLHKPVGFVCSQDGQGAPTVFDLLPSEYAHLKIAGRLDKDSSGLVVLTNDGDLAFELTHPSNDKRKVYEVTLHKSLVQADKLQFERGIDINDKRLSRMQLQGKGKAWTVTMHEGRNRQIRRTFDAKNYEVITLHRTKLADYSLEDLEPKQFKLV